MRLGSLFAGIGGFDLAAQRCGIEIGWQVEIDEWCRRVLAKHWPDVPKYGDIREVTELPYVDIIAGGFPCQPVSVAGRGLAQDDPRWLWPEFERIIRLVRPRYIVVENVPGLLQRGFDDVLGSLAACGYDAEWQCLPASAFGAPHQRDRLWIVAYPNGEHNAPERGQCAAAAGEGLERRDDRGRGQGDAERQESVRGSGQDTSPLSNSASLSEREPNHKAHTFPEGGQAWEVPECRAWWEAEPGVCRVADGISHWDDRIRGLGNAIVPQCAEWIFRQILENE